MDPITNPEDKKYHLGKFYFQRGDFKKAIKAYEEGLIVNPQAIILLYEIGLVYWKLKDYRNSSKYWKKLLAIAPFSIPAIQAKDKLASKSTIRSETSTGLKNCAPCSMTSVLERLAAECRKAIIEAEKKGIISCPIANGSTTSAAIDRKK